MPRAAYDPQKAHDYYERTKELKGRKKGHGDEPHPKPKAPLATEAERATVARISAKLDRLRSLLREKRAASKDEKPKTAGEKLKDRQQSKEYYDKHKQSIKNLRQGSGGGSKGTDSKPKTAAEMTADELETAIRNTVNQLKQAIAETRRR